MDDIIAELVLVIDGENVMSEGLTAEDFEDFNPFEFGEKIGYRVGDELAERKLIA